MLINMNMFNKFVFFIFTPLFGMQLTPDQVNFAVTYFNLATPPGLISPYQIFFDDFEDVIARVEDGIKIQEIKREIDSDAFYVGMASGVGIIPCATEVMCPECRIPIYGLSIWLFKKVFDFHFSDEAEMDNQIRIQKEWVRYLKDLRQLWVGRNSCGG